MDGRPGVAPAGAPAARVTPSRTPCAGLRPPATTVASQLICRVSPVSWWLVPVGRPGHSGAQPVTVAIVTDNSDIRLLGFAGFKASERFLRALDDEIWVSRWDNPPKIPVDRPESLGSGDAMKAELERPSLVTVLSAHAYFCNGRFVGFCGEGDQPSVLLAGSIATFGAASMLLIDACEVPDVVAELESHARPGRDSGDMSRLSLWRRAAP